MSKRPNSAVSQDDVMPEAPLAADHVTQLRAAVLSRCSADCLSACSSIMGAGVSRNDLFDHYIPAVAHVLGTDWSRDKISFAATTMGVVRLQWLLRALEPAPDPGMDRDVPGILILVPAGEHHTLGAVLLSTQLRRRGFCVSLMLEARPDAIARRMRGTSFQATMISTSPGPHNRDLRALVTASRRVMENDAPVLIGGTIAQEDIDLKDLSGADHVTVDAEEALALCDLRLKDRVAETI